MDIFNRKKSINVLLALSFFVLVGSSFAQTTASKKSPTDPKNNNVTRPPRTNKICWLVANNTYRDILQHYLEAGAKLVMVNIGHIKGHPDGIFTDHLSHVYKPYHWVRSTSKQGRSLLMLDSDYDHMSLGILAMGVEEMDVDLSQNPPGCLWGLSEVDTIHILRASFLNDFKIPEEGKSASLSADEHICNVQILPDDGTAEFIYRCCHIHISGSGKMECKDMFKDFWTNLLKVMITLIKVLVVLYSPMFLPESMYRLKYVASEYIHHLKGKPIKLKVVVTDNPGQYGPETKHKRIRLNRLKYMNVFKTMVSSGSWAQDKIYEVLVKDIRLSVKVRRLLDLGTFPVTLFKLLKNNLLRCRIRKLEALTPCCEASILGKFKPDFHIKWEKLVKAISSLVVLLIFAIPWFLRVSIYASHEKQMYTHRQEAAEKIGLEMGYTGSLVSYLGPVHGLFIIIYIIFIVDSLVYNVISVAMKEKFKYVMRQCLRDMKERSKLGVLSWMTELILLPFREFGLLGIILFLPYLAILMIVTLPIFAFYMVPTINLTIRLIIHIIIFMLPRSISEKITNLWIEKTHKVRSHFRTDRVTTGDTFIPKSQYTTKGLILQIIIIIMCLISFWSITIMLMEIFSYFVECFVYMFMGIIINAGVMMQYVTVLFLLVLYSKNTFSKVHRIYQTYHKVIHKELLAMNREEIDEVAKQEMSDQENTTFHVIGDMAPLTLPRDARPKLKMKDQQPHWQTSSMLVFLDKQDTPYTPETFFFQVIDLNYYGCPGPIYSNVSAAMLEFGRIVMFLFFVFVVVMAFGDAYQISSTNQLLATVVGGFVPFLFRFIFTAQSSVSEVDTTSVQFKTEFHKAINNYTQCWAIHDIIPVENGIREWTGLPEDIVSNLFPVDENDNESESGNITTLGDANSSTAPLLESSRASTPDDILGGRNGRNRPISYISVAEQLENVDLIVDISTPKTRTVNTLLTTGFEKGSVTMLDNNSYSRRPNSQVYQPTTYTPGDVV